MNQRELWISIEHDLARARQVLPDSVLTHEAISQYHEFLGHNELELACDALERYANEHPVPNDFWIALRDAAMKMNLSDHAARYEKRISN
ncbi:hypothetical protein ACFPT7_02505 [Acidicapsa dinghuensis]|uniref:MafI family immunity protein n=1 Tax=Acidicapsa dinghuensis TaxID=2218256 RepID=A0ABW1EA02_9BACT|nr:hypothetical protein [Acidicapsa dinghuensis]